MINNGGVTRLAGSRYLWLAAAALSLVFANGRWIIPTVAWLAPLFMLVYLRLERPGRGLLLGFLVQLGTYFIQWWEIIPAPGALYFAISGTYALCYFIPFALDRLIGTRLAGVRSALVFPAAWVVVEVLIQKFTPYGSWASVGYTQAERLPLMQIASVTGMAGIGFLIAWLAAVIAWMTTSTVVWRVKLAGLAACGAIVLGVLVWGEVRLARAPDVSSSVTAAMLTPSSALTSQLERQTRASFSGSAPADATDLVRETAAPLNADLLERTRESARAGATVVVWSEHAARVLKDDEPAWLEEVRNTAQAEGIYLFASVGVWNPGARPPLENKVVAIEPNGNVAWEHQKARPIVGSEHHLLPPAHDVVPTLDAPFGSMSAVVCHDLDFPDLVRAVGSSRASILVAPSADWSVIARLHARMALGRAIENGVSVIRPVQDGLSMAFDAFGRTIARQFDPEGGRQMLLAQVPVYETRTLYPATGDAMLWLAVALLAGLGWVVVRARGVSVPLTTILLATVLVASGASVSTAGETKLIEFNLKDQFGRKHRHEDALGRVSVFIGGNRKSSKSNPVWGKALSDSLEGRLTPEVFAMYPLADLRGVPFFIKGMVRGKFPKDEQKWVLMDWKGRFAKAYDFVPDETNILVFDPEGALAYQTHGTTLDELVLGMLVYEVRTLLRDRASDDGSE